MNKLLSIIYAAAIGCVLSGCAADYVYTEDDLKNDYLVTWIKAYGLIDPEQDWNMAETVEMAVNPSDFGLGTGCVVCIYNDDPLCGGAIIGRTSTPQILKMDVVKGAEKLYVRAYNSPRSICVNAIATITGGKAAISSLSRAEGTDQGQPVDDDGHTKIAYNWLLACEDMGTLGDIDFNDIVLGLTYVSGETKLTITPLAAGGTLEAYVRFGGTELGEIHNSFGVSSTTMFNTKGWSRVGTPWEVSVPADFSVTDKMGGISLRIKRPEGDRLVSTIIQAPSQLGEAPSIICVPGNWEWPTEYTSIHTAYPGFANWSKDNTLTDWIDHAADNTFTVSRPNNTLSTPTSQLLRRTVTVEGVEREYILYVPAQSSESSALIVSLHGANNNATDYMPIKYDATVPDADYIIAYPQGVGQDFPFFGSTPVPGWDAVRPENISIYAPVQENVDTKFLRALVDDVAKTYKFSRDRVYCCGFSNGGMMCYAVAATLSDVFAACASIEGFPVNEFHLLTSGPRPVPFLHIHGKADDLVKYALFPMIRDCMVTRNGCNPVPATTSYNESGNRFTKRIYVPAAEDGAVYVTYEVDGLGHYYASENLNFWNTTQVMWDFLKDKRRSTGTNNLVWRLNIDAPGFDNPYGYSSASPDWDKWDMEVNAAKTRYVFGHTDKQELSTTNVYPAIQFAPGDYYIEYSATGTDGNSVHVDLTNISDSNSKIHGSSDVNSPAKKWFHIYGNGNYKLTLLKDDASDKFNTITIYRDPTGEHDAVNFTADSWN